MSDTAEAIQLFAAIAFLAIGLSHLLLPKAWVAFFQALAARGTTGVFAEGFITLNFGALIVAFHNVWQWPAIVLTLIGWAQVLKGTLRFVAPQIGLRIMQSVSPEKAWHFQAAGAFSLLVSAFLWWLRFRS